MCLKLKDAAANFLAQIVEGKEEVQREGLADTPMRVAKAWQFWTSGYNIDPASVLKTFGDGGEGYDEMVYQTGIPFFSHCEHHLVPFFGYVHIAYLPGGRVVGLSKLARLVEVYARRLSVQERLTNQIANALEEHLKCRGAAVVTQARHLCMESRGVQKIGTSTICSSLRGEFKSDARLRAEFMSLVNATIAGIKVL